MLYICIYTYIHNFRYMHASPYALYMTLHSYSLAYLKLLLKMNTSGPYAYFRSRDAAASQCILPHTSMPSLMHLSVQERKAQAASGLTLSLGFRVLRDASSSIETLPRSTTCSCSRLVIWCGARSACLIQALSPMKPW